MKNVCTDLSGYFIHWERTHIGGHHKKNLVCQARDDHRGSRAIASAMIDETRTPKQTKPRGNGRARDNTRIHRMHFFCVSVGDVNTRIPRDKQPNVSQVNCSIQMVENLQLSFSTRKHRIVCVR